MGCGTKSFLLSCILFLFFKFKKAKEVLLEIKVPSTNSGIGIYDSSQFLTSQLLEIEVFSLILGNREEPHST
jgi:hypothetical protein